MDDYSKKVARAVRLLQSIPKDGPIEVSYSGGKDSDVILELAKMAGIEYRAIYKNTTIDPPGTIKHCKEKGVEILQPKKTFFKVVEENGDPSRFFRTCCSHLKEYKVLDRAIQGIRRSESIKRRQRYTEPEECRVYKTGGKVKIYFPILDWTDEDVARFIKERGIQCHSLYYDENGDFHPERRLGCIGCPLANHRSRRKQLQDNPKILKAWIKALKIYYMNHSETSAKERFGNNAYNVMFFSLFCNNMEEYREKVALDLWGNQLDTKAYLEEYFGVEL